MKKQILFIALFFTLSKTEGQVVFCPPGAEWHYNFQWPVNSANPGAIENEKIRYVRDSILNGETVKVLRHGRFYSSANFPQTSGYIITLIKQKGDTVFMKNNGTRNRWQILYNFATQPGQAWQDSIGEVDPAISAVVPGAYSYTTTVDSVKDVFINNFSLKRLYVKYSVIIEYFPFNIIFTGQITERFGCSQFMFNYFPWHHDNSEAGPEVIKDFLCYRDDTFGLKQFTDKPCDYQDYVGITKNYLTANIKIYPNPTHDVFTFSTQDELITGKSFVSIKDLCGREVKQFEISCLNQDKSDSYRIDISDLAKGVYILNLSNNNEIVYTGKLVKSD